MLAELFILHRNLRLQGLGVARVHRDFDSPSIKNRLTLRVKLDKAGSIRQISLLPSDLEPGLWTLKSGNHSYFPAVRTDRIPLLHLRPEAPLWIRVEKSLNAALITELCVTAVSASAQLDFRAVSQKQAARIAAWPTTEGNETKQRIKDFVQGFQTFVADPAHTAAELLSGVERTAATVSDPTLLAALVALIIGELKSKKGKGKTLADARVEYGAQLLFDFWSEDDPSFSLYSYSVREIVLDTLLAQDPILAAGNDTLGAIQQGICALTGKPAALLRAPFPGWAAKPVISKSLRPFDKFSAAPCNFRYQHADSEGFDVGEITANAVVGALTTVTTEPMRGKTWRPLRNGVTGPNGMEQSDVLIAYPSCSIFDLQNEPMLKIVDVIGEPDSMSDDADAAHSKSFQDAAEPVCNAFDKAIQREAAAQHFVPELLILLIRQVSSGQIQLAYSAQPSLVSFVAAVDAWSQSESNLPASLRIPIRSDKNSSGFVLAKPRLIFPERISRVLARQWIRSGSDSTAVPAPAVSMMLDVFLRRPGALPTLAAELLAITLSRTEPLLYGVGGAIHRDQWKNFLKDAAKGKGKPDVGYAAIHTISLIGSLLYAMDSKASDYTRRSAFLVGKLLAMMDELHKHYCVVVRDGAIPPSLIGNSLLGRATDGPAQALAELCDRSRPYIGWAKTVATPGKNAPEAIRIAVNSARKLLRVAQPLCEQLGADESLDQSLGNLDKAHLLLGYLSPVLTRDSKADAIAGDEADATDTPTDEVQIA